ncbi:MAG: VCBS repeat-containing protein [Saprospiraceae bacterium]|nr:VCBS repeat-containing protein [Saprospiraceae bacterium]
MKNSLAKGFFLLIIFIKINILSSQDYYYAAIPGDTVILTINDFSSGSIQWQERDDDFDVWKDIPGAIINRYKSLVEKTNSNSKFYRAKVLKSGDPCFSYSSVIRQRIVQKVSDIQDGDFYAGGLVFYKQDSLGLVVAPYNNVEPLYGDQGFAPWGCFGVNIAGADSSGIGYGRENNRDILLDCNNPGIAAFMCDTLKLNGFDDWFLPSVDELWLLFDLHINNLVPFFSTVVNSGLDTHWSSTEHSSNSSWGIAGITSSGYPLRVAPDKIKELRVRAIRQFFRSSVLTFECSTILLNSGLIYDVVVKKIDSIPANVIVKFIGVGNDTDHYEWDFGKGLVISGSGRGPYEINYNFGGYNKISVKNSSSNCANDIAQSDYFRVKLFENLNLKLPHIHLGAFDWGDYNNDGLLDILMTGGLHFEIYKNVGIDSFNIIPLQFPKITLSGCDWGDFNNDKLLDFAVCGLADSICITEVYQNIGNDSFVKLNINLPGVKNGFVKWFDQNNDGILELLLSGEDNNNQALTKIYSGFAKAEPIEFNTNILNLKNSNGSFGDYNNDGFSDLLILGNDGTNRRTLLYKNENGQFVLIPTHFIDIEYGSVDWGDYDNDGALDFAITGAKDSIGIEYFNGGGGLKVSFSEVVFAGIYRQISTDSFNHKIVFNKYYNYALSELNWGDYDNDGFIDLAIAGVPRLSYVSTGIGGGKVPITYPSLVSIFRNYQDHTFNNIFVNIPNFLEILDNGNIIDGPSHDFACSYVAFGDYNNDGNLDILREGAGAIGSSIYKNLTSTKNFPPNAPKNLYSIPDCNKVQLNWGPAQDDHTPTQSIIYEIYIGSSPGKSDVLSEVNTYNIRNTHFVINNLKPGTYYWSVKAIDQAQSASAYAPEQSFTISPKPATPRISFNGIKLHSDAADGNQWYDQNGPVIGATQQEFLPIANGIYYVVISSNGCSSDTSNKLQVVLTGSSDLNRNFKIKTYPNPVSTELYIEIDGFAEQVSFEIINAMGQKVYHNSFKEKTKISTSSLKVGMYFIRFNIQNSYVFRKIIKN